MSAKMKWIQNIAAFGIFAALILYILFHTTDNPRYHLILDERGMLLEALWNTLYISLISLVLCMAAGFLFYLLLNSRIQLIKAIAVIFREIIMGTPMLVMVFLMVYVFGNLIGVSDKVVLGITALTVYTMPYVANSYESAASVIDKDQYVVMELYHFSGVQKYLYVIFPQIAKPMLPALINHLSGIIKGSALLKIVSVPEISYVLTAISSKNWASIEGYLVMWLMYLIITIPLSVLAQYAGRRLSYEN
ncbi:amino acid ABC transporter permease [Claveliimonas bilis]|uniref:Amino acid ABC transporter permease n=1 Tax=Claveliimonas bilis TaxID=3028070 RepID=A0ABN6YZP3_9FIRM|nr:ABC transporter permease subunit [Claveliimonas bilis]BDZ78335.1 amino acid ABC transporter permease [Claveliimonas bilis]BDZ80717.1 amino acid ABC transporter permease [Claveliimonas bilis]HIZ61030.1 ABC transporter permease subunit [Candidatus Dorea faecipullorum]